MSETYVTFFSPTQRRWRAIGSDGQRHWQFHSALHHFRLQRHQNLDDWQRHPFHQYVFWRGICLNIRRMLCKIEKVKHNLTIQPAVQNNYNAKKNLLPLIVAVLLKQLPITRCKMTTSRFAISPPRTLAITPVSLTKPFPWSMSPIHRRGKFIWLSSVSFSSNAFLSIQTNTALIF